MKKLIPIIFVFSSLLISQSNLFSQQDTIKSNTVIPQDSLGRHLWYVELMGNSIGASFNYEYIMIRDFLYTDKINLRIGMGSGLPIDYFNVPTMIIFNFGKKYCIEIGFGVLFDKTLKENEKHFDYSSQTIKYITVFGYRYYSDSGTIIRAGLTPFYSTDKSWRLWTGISFGHYF